MKKRSLIVLISIFLIPGIHAQELEGIYSYLSPFQEHYNYYKFQNNGSFEYHSGASGGDHCYGKGNFKISKEFLILNYNETELGSFSGYHQLRSWQNKKDSVEFLVKVMDLTGNNLNRAHLFITDNNKKYVVNEEGEILVRTKKSDELIKMAVVNLGYQEYFFELPPNLNYEIKVHLEENRKGIPIKDQIDTLRIIGGKDLFEFRDRNGNIWKRKRETKSIH